jgi:hypothetical protein
LMAKRLDDTEAWKRDGAYSAAQLVARELGSSVAHARQAIDTVGKLEWLTDTKTAFLAGGLSQAQAAVIAPAALAAPGMEAELIQTAQLVPLAKLREKCGEVELRADTSSDQRERRHRNRSVRAENAPDGMRRYEALVPRDMAGEIEAVWDEFTDRAFRQARSDGRREGREQYMADGLVAMARAANAGVTGKRTSGVKPIRPRFIIRLDARPLKTGTVEPGEVCEIVGVGPIDLATARALLPDGLIDFVVAEGVDIRAVAHGGRKANITQLVALWSREYVCEIEGCEVREHLHKDHIAEYGKTRRTCATSLGWKCPHCHHLKTHLHYTDGPLQANGRRKLIPPDRPPPHDDTS